MRRLATAACLLAGCAPTYAPPVHSIHGGVPRPSLESFMVDLADVDAVIPGAAGAVPLTRHLAAEVGGDVAADLAPEVTTSWKMAHAGLRAMTGVGDPAAGLAADLELGGGIGSGGASAVDGEDDSRTASALAWGGYLGAGFGGQGELLGGFLRARVDLSASRDDRVPTTRWASLVGGVQLSSGGGPRFRLAAGLAAYDNDREARAAPIVELGLELGGGPPPPPLPARSPARWHRFPRHRGR